MNITPLTDDQKTHPTYRVLETLFDLADCEFVIAGGSVHALVRDQTPDPDGDYDVFFFSYSDYEKMLVALMTMSMNDIGVVKRLLETPYAITFNVFGSKVQLIKQIFASNESSKEKDDGLRILFNSFDLSVSCYAIDKHNLYRHSLFIMVDSESIIIQTFAVVNYARTLNRIMKYVKRGCSVDIQQIITILDDIKDNPSKVNNTLMKYNFNGMLTKELKNEKYVWDFL